MNLQITDAHLCDLRQAREQRMAELGAVRAREEFALAIARTEARLREWRAKDEAAAKSQ